MGEAIQHPLATATDPGGLASLAGNFDFAGTDALVAKTKQVNGVMRGHK